jgi:hypothetical protein
LQFLQESSQHREDLLREPSSKADLRPYRSKKVSGKTKEGKEIEILVCQKCGTKQQVVYYHSNGDKTLACGHEYLIDNEN